MALLLPLVYLTIHKEWGLDSFNNKTLRSGILLNRAIAKNNNSLPKEFDKIPFVDWEEIFKPFSSVINSMDNFGRFIAKASEIDPLLIDSHYTVIVKDAIENFEPYTTKGISDNRRLNIVESIIQGITKPNTKAVLSIILLKA